MDESDRHGSVPSTGVELAEIVGECDEQDFAANARFSPEGDLAEAACVLSFAEGVSGLLGRLQTTGVFIS